jgi:hypothetical protein
VVLEGNNSDEDELLQLYSTDNDQIVEPGHASDHIAIIASVSAEPRTPGSVPRSSRAVHASDITTCAQDSNSQTSALGHDMTDAAGVHDAGDGIVGGSLACTPIAGKKALPRIGTPMVCGCWLVFTRLMYWSRQIVLLKICLGLG